MGSAGLASVSSERSIVIVETVTLQRWQLASQLAGPSPHKGGPFPWGQWFRTGVSGQTLEGTPYEEDTASKLAPLTIHPSIATLLVSTPRSLAYSHPPPPSTQAPLLPLGTEANGRGAAGKGLEHSWGVVLTLASYPHTMGTTRQQVCLDPLSSSSWGIGTGLLSLLSRAASGLSGYFSRSSS